MLTEDNLCDYVDLQSVIQKHEERVYRRVEEVALIICTMFETELHSIRYPRAVGKEDDVFALINHDPIRSPYRTDILSARSGEHNNYVRFRTRARDYSMSFPKRFLFMKNNDIMFEIGEHIRETREYDRVNNIIEQNRLGEKD